MRGIIWIFAALALAPLLSADSNSPKYTAAGVVNAADNLPGLAPNTLASLYGVGLSYVTAAMTPADIQGGALPTVLPGTGVRVFVGNIPAVIYYVSPLQINFLVPSDLLPGPSTVEVALDGLNGSAVAIKLAATSPALFQVDAQHVVALHADGSVITPAAPAKPGDIVILYATGLGQTIPNIVYGQLYDAAAPLAEIAEFKLVLNGETAGPEFVAYAGIAPGYAGLYQINVMLPKSTKANPEIQIGIGSQLSRSKLYLPVQP